MKILYDAKINGEVVAKGISRSSDNSEAAYQNDLHPLSISGDFNDLINVPNTFVISHNNTEGHIEDYVTTTVSQQKMNGAETAAKTYTDNMESRVDSEITNINSDLDQLSTNMSRWKDEFVNHFNSL
jgi:hypothetical protein